MSAVMFEQILSLRTTIKTNMENSEENIYNISTFQSFQRFNNEWTLFLLIKTTKLVHDRIKCGDCHVTEILSDYFKRPNKMKSLGFGCPKFVSLETLRTRNYIRDNTIFITIDVEPLDISWLLFSAQKIRYVWKIGHFVRDLPNEDCG